MRDKHTFRQNEHNFAELNINCAIKPMEKGAVVNKYIKKDASRIFITV